MRSSNKVRRSWGKEEKVFFAKMLQTPLKSGHPKTVSEISAEYGISAKLLYEWRDLYNKYGENGFDQKKRKVYESISRDVELTDRLLALSLLHPDWGAKKLIDGLKAENAEAYTPSIPTVLKILHQHNLGTAEQRYGAAEHAYFRGNSTLPRDLIDLLFKHNPYLRLLESNRRVNGLLFLLKSIPLSRYFGKSAGSLFIAIEANSLVTFGQHWDGKGLEDLATLIDLTAMLGKGRSQADAYYLAEDHSIFYKTKCTVNWLDTRSSGINKTLYFELMKPQFIAIQKFLRGYKFLDAKGFDSDLRSFLLEYTISRGSYGYPTFGNSPHNALKNHQENLLFDQLGKRRNSR